MIRVPEWMRSIVRSISNKRTEAVSPSHPRDIGTTELVVTDESERQRRVFQFQQDVEIAVLRLGKESRDVFDRHEQAISDLEKAMKTAGFYKWVANGLMLVLFGSAIGLYYKSDDYIDSRISTRVIKSDRLALALNQAQFGRWRDALAILDEVRRDAEEDKTNVDATFREFLYDNMIWVLAGIGDMNPDGSWVGKVQYDALMKDQAFISMMVREGSTGDPIRYQSLALCILKYDEGRDAVQRAKSYLEHALAHLDVVEGQADVHWTLAMLYLSSGSAEQAKDHLIQASILHPNLYHLSDLRKYENSFLNSAEFQMWDRIAKRLRQTQFASKYRALARELSNFVQDS